MWIAHRIVQPTEVETGLQIVRTSVLMIGIGVMIVRPSVHWRDGTIGIPESIGTAVNPAAEIVDRSGWRIVRRSGLLIGPLNGPLNGLSTIATVKVVVVAAAVGGDNGILAVVIVAAGGISGTTAIFAPRAVAEVAAADTASNRAAATIRSVIRTMGVAVVARVARDSSRRRRPSRWCRRNR